MDLLSFIRTTDPTKVRIGERQCSGDEPRLLETNVGRVVLLLPVAPDRSSGKLEASVDKLLDEGGSGEQAEQGHSASVYGETIPTLPFVTSSVSATPERGGEGHTDSVTGPNLRTISAPQRFVISSDSSHHSGANITEAEVDSFARPVVPVITAATITTLIVDPAMVVKEKIVKPSLFSADFASALILPWAALHILLAVISLAAHQMSLSAEVVKEKDTLLKAKDEEIESLKVQLLLKEAEAAEAIRLRTKASKFEAVEKSLHDEVEALKEFNNDLEKEKSELDVKVADLAASVKVREHEIADIDVVITSVRSQMTILFMSWRYLLPEFKRKLQYTRVCLNSHEYLSTLGTAIGKAIEKGTQEGLAASIVHGKEGKVLTDVAAYNPSAEGDYISALQQLQRVTFSLLAELKSHKDSSIETVIDILRLDEPLAEKLNLNELQPNVDQLMVLIHHSQDKVVAGAFAISLALGVSDSRVWRIRDNIANHRSTLRNVFVLLVEPFSVDVLMGTKDDYKATSIDDQAAANENVAGESTNPFPNVDDVEFVVPQ
nr:hypothetical protein [Tanacetum cinerariifolium]